MQTALASQQRTSLVQLRSSGELPSMALSAGRLDVLGRKNRLFPCERAAMRLRNRRRSALATMARCASKLVQLVRDRRMPAIGLGRDIAQAGFFQSNMATGTAIHYAKIGEPDLLDTAGKVPLQRIGIAAVANRFKIAVLIMAPFTEEILGRRDRDGRKKDHTDHAKGAHAVSEQFLPQRRRFFIHDRRILYEPCHGQTQAQPGPRKKVPMAVNTTSSNKNQVITQYERGRPAR